MPIKAASLGFASKDCCRFCQDGSLFVDIRGDDAVGFEGIIPTVEGQMAGGS